MAYELESSAAALYDGGWRAKDKEDLMQEYGIDEDKADAICELLKGYEK